MSLKSAKSSPLRFYETREKQRCKSCYNCTFFVLKYGTCSHLAVSILKVHTPPLYLKRPYRKNSCDPRPQENVHHIYIFEGLVRFSRFYMLFINNLIRDDIL